MNIESQLFFGHSIDTITLDYENWKKQFVDYVDYEFEGSQFCLVNDMSIHKLVLYVARLFFYHNEHVYIMEVSALETFKNIEEAQAQCNGIIEYYTRGNIYTVETIR